MRVAPVLLGDAHVGLVSIDGLSAPQLLAWRDLAKRSAEPNPFYEPPAVLAAHRWLGGKGVELLVAEAEGRWIACLPVRRSPRWRRAPVPVLAGWRHDYCYLGSPLVDAAADEMAVRSIVQALPGLAEGAWLAVLEWIAEDGFVGRGLRVALAEAGLSTLAYQPHVRATLARDEHNSLARAVSGRHLREFRRLVRAGARQGGAMSILDCSADPGGVDRFLDLEAAGWKGRVGTAMASNPCHAEFFRSVCASMAAEGRLQLLALEAGGAPVAMKCSLLAGDTLFYFKSAYDERAADFRPGIVLEVLALERFLDGGFSPRIRRIDSCTDPGNQVLNRLLPARRHLATMLIALRPRLGGGVLALARRRDTNSRRNSNGRSGHA